MIGEIIKNHCLSLNETICVNHNFDLWYRL